MAAKCCGFSPRFMARRRQAKRRKEKRRSGEASDTLMIPDFFGSWKMGHLYSGDSTDPDWNIVLLRFYKLLTIINMGKWSCNIWEKWTDQPVLVDDELGVTLSNVLGITRKSGGSLLADQRGFEHWESIARRNWTWCEKNWGLTQKHRDFIHKKRTCWEWVF